jgi:hypothetical protein
MNFFRSVVWLAVTLILTLCVRRSACDENVADTATLATDATNFESAEPTVTQSDSAATSEGVTNVTPPPVVEDENTKIARELFRAASAMLNSSSPDRHLAWETMERSADLGNVDAKVRIAFAKLTGVYFEQVWLLFPTTTSAILVATSYRSLAFSH